MATELTPALVYEIRQVLETGLSFREAADFAGVSYTTLKKWYRAGRARFGGDRVTSSDIFIDFFTTVNKARATGTRNLLRSILNASRKDWKAAQYLLERRDKRKAIDSAQAVKEMPAVAQQRAIEAARVLLEKEPIMESMK